MAHQHPSLSEENDPHSQASLEQKAPAKEDTPAEQGQERLPRPPGPVSGSSATTETIIGWILRIGVSVSAALIVAGVALLFFSGSTGYGTSLGDLNKLVCYNCNAGQRFPTTPGDVLAGLAHLQPYALIALGLLVLIATPVLRVAASVILFLLERDHAYILITLIVLTILAVNVLGDGLRDAMDPRD